MAIIQCFNSEKHSPRLHPSAEELGRVINKKSYFFGGKLGHGRQ